MKLIDAVKSRWDVIKGPVGDQPKGEYNKVVQTLSFVKLALRRGYTPKYGVS